MKYLKLQIIFKYKKYPLLYLNLFSAKSSKFTLNNKKLVNDKAQNAKEENEEERHETFHEL